MSEGKKFDAGIFLKYLPLLAPLPEGYAVGISIWKYMDWHPVITVVAALIVSGTGFYGVQIANRLSEFNATLFSDEQKLKFQLPTWKAWGILGVWFLGVTALTVFLETAPFLRILTPLGLVVIGFCASYLYALSNILNEHEEARAKHRVVKVREREETRNEKKHERKKRQDTVQEMEVLRQSISRKLNVGQARKRPRGGAKLSPERLLLEWTRDPYLTPTEMERVLWEDGKGVKVTRQAISQRREAMVKSGIITIEADGRVTELISSALESVTGEG